MSNGIPVILAVIGLVACLPHASSSDTSGAEPLVGVYVTQADIANAKGNIQRYDWARSEWDRIKAIADQWLSRDDDWIRRSVPAKGSTFAYGTTGCPACGASWTSFGRGQCSWDEPGVVTCPACKRKFPDPDPKSPYHDTGQGITLKGLKYYPAGVWNAWVVEQLTAGFDYDASAIRNLGFAYAFTGDARYAHKAAVILDALATVQPTTIGPRDFAPNDESLQGRFHQLTSIVFRAKMHQISAYDLIGRFDELDKPSPTNPGLSMRENIVKNMLEDYLFLHVDVSGGKLESLHNHEGDCVRGMLGVGMVTGNPDYIKWGLDAISYYISNSIDRDGQYYETSAGYSNFGTSVIFDMAQVAANYSPSHYPNPERFPKPDDYPYKLNFFNNPRLATACLRAELDLDCAGHTPGFGNSHSSTAIVTQEREPQVNAQWADMFLAKSTDSQIRELAASRLANSSKDRKEIARSGIWCTLFAKDLPKRDYPSTLPRESTLLGGRDLGILRSGEGANRRAALMRDGCTMPHGHDDTLGLLLFGKGRDFNYEVGYGIFGTPVHMGWGTRQACHNLVVVDDDLNHPEGLYRRSPGGGTLLLGKEGPISVLEMDGLGSRGSEKLSMYRRAVAQIDISPEDFYWVDVFRVAGGRQHDYLFHAKWSAGNPSDFGTTDLEFTRPEAWTLAGLNPQFRGASFDKPGWSWGERIVPGEFIKEMGDPAEKIGGRGWMPPPGNGYAFLHDVRTAAAAAPWTAEWRNLDPNDTRMRMISLPQPGTQVITALGPTLDGKHQMHFVIARHGAESNAASRFVSVFVPHQGDCAVRSAEEIALSPEDPMAVCVKITLADGRVDYVLSATSPGKRRIALDGGLRIAFNGQYGLVRTGGGQVISTHLFNGTELSCGSESLTTGQSSIEAKIASVDEATRTITLDSSANSSDLQGRIALIHTENCPRRAAYTITGASSESGKLKLTLQCCDLVLARGVLDKNPEGNVLSSRIPVPFSTSTGVATHYFDRCPIRNTRTGRIDRIRTFDGLKTLEVDDPTDWKFGDAFEILDFTPGDAVSIPLSASTK